MIDWRISKREFQVVKEFQGSVLLICLGALLTMVFRPPSVGSKENARSRPPWGHGGIQVIP